MNLLRDESIKRLENSLPFVIIGSQSCHSLRFFPRIPKKTWSLAWIFQFIKNRKRQYFEKHQELRKNLGKYREIFSVFEFHSFSFSNKDVAVNYAVGKLLSEAGKKRDYSYYCCLSYLLLAWIGKANNNLASKTFPCYIFLSCCIFCSNLVPTILC